MVRVIISAHDICATRLCRAANCTHDAEPYSRFCWLCSRRPRITEHPAHGPLDGPTLRCCTCHAFKPDNEFSIQRGNKGQHRRERNAECRTCAAQRRVLARALRTPQQIEHDAIKSRARWNAYKAKRNAERRKDAS